MKNADLPAMPITSAADYQYCGLSKRERAAIAMMQGILANSNYEAPRRTKLAGIAKDAVSAASALFDELERTT